jgi:hypothetical protein
VTGAQGGIKGRYFRGEVCDVVDKRSIFVLVVLDKNCDERKFTVEYPVSSFVQSSAQSACRQDQELSLHPGERP